MFPPIASCRPAIRLWLTFFLPVAAAIVSLFTPAAEAQTVAFPGALGFGANATGGRNGTVYHVTTLADSGAGSFRTGVASGNRTIVFDVGGEIKLLTAVSCSSSLTIAGQTAPGGIVFNGGEISFANRNNIICRYIRIRPGSDTASTGDDALSFYRASNIIMDHSSIAFAPWNNIDGVGDSTHLVTDITVQNSINANPTGQQFGCHAESVGGQWSWQYNIFANSHNRNPLAKVNDTFINNLEYNNSAGYTTHTSTRFKHDLVNNYFIAGPASSSSNFPWYQVDNNQSMYFTGNFYDADKNGALGGSTTAPLPGYQGGGTILSAPWSSWTTIIPTVTPALAYRYNVSAAGAWPRDEIDSQLIGQIKTLGTGGPGGSLYTSQTQTGLGNNGYGTLTGLTAPTDTDNDGMPDYWELANGSATNGANSLTNTITGYTLLENYLNFLGAPHGVTQTNTPVDINLSQFTAGFSSATFSLTNATNGTATLLNSTNAHFVPTANFSGLGTFNFSVTEGSYALSAVVTICVSPVAPPASATQFNGAMVIVATNASAVSVVPPSNLIWRGDGTANVWNTSVSNWLNGANLFSAFKNGDVVTFDDTGSNSPAINLNTTVLPGAIIFNDDKNYTVSGSGVLSGAGSLTKTGMGTLQIGTTNSGFSGTISVNGGTLALNSGTSIGSGAITLSGGATLGLPGGNTATSISGNITVPSGENVSITSGYVADGGFSSFISGDTNSTLNFVGNQSFGGSSSSQFSGFNGTINIASGSIRFSANSSGNTYGSLNPNFIINGSLQPRNAGNTIVFGALNGSGQLQGPQTAGTGTGNTVFNIGGKNLDAIFTGTIISNANSAGSAICVNKLGTGTQTLNGNNTFSGTNGILAGALYLNGTNMPSLVTVFSGATLGGTGVLTGPVSVKSGGRLAPGAAGLGSIGTLNINNHLTNATPTLYFDLSGNPSGANDHINLTGTLAMTGVQTFIFNLTENSLGAGTYGLIEGATSSTVSGISFAHNLPPTTRQTFSITNPSAASNPSWNRLTVTGSAAALVWSGTNGNAWDLTSTANWFNGNSADIFYNLDQVVFNDTSTNGGVAMSGTVQPATLLVSNNATSFTFSNGVVGGFTALTKTGSGALTLNASNSFTGGTIINGGILHAGNVYALGTGKITLNGGALHLNSVDPANAIAATGTNTLQVTSQGVNTYPNFTLTGSGRLNLTIDGNSVFSPGGNWSAFSGYIYFTGGKSLRALSANIGSANAIWDLGTSTTSIFNRDGGYTVYFGALLGGSGTSLSGASTTSVGTTTYVVGDLNTNCTFGGVISDNASPTALFKSGSATLTLTGANTFTGGTTVSSGTLNVDSSAGSGSGTGDLEVFSGATLSGNGSIGSATTIDNGATLAPGDPSGALTFTNSLTLNDSSILQFALGTNSDAAVVGGNLFLTGQLNVTDGGGFGASAYTIFTCAGALTFDNLVLTSAPAGFIYSFNTNTPGVVKLIVAPTTPPAFGNLTISSKTNLVMSGSNGAPLGNYYLLATTNLTLPLANWTRVATNQFDAGGRFIFTNPIGAVQQNFFRLQQ